MSHYLLTLPYICLLKSCVLYGPLHLMIWCILWSSAQCGLVHPTDWYALQSIKYGKSCKINEGWLNQIYEPGQTNRIQTA